jgi:hypothetical protein
MNDRPTNEERGALLAEELLADLLADESTWAEPRAGLEDSVVEAVLDGTRRWAAPRRRRFLLSAVAAAAAAAIVVGGVVEAGRETSADFEAQLDATVLAPGAHATADITRTNAGFRIVLDARGLPTLDAGNYYQAWLKDERGTLVPIGTFSSSDGRVTLWSGVSPKNFPALSVTIESTDNHQTSSGHRVLTGRVHAG